MKMHTVPSIAVQSGQVIGQRDQQEDTCGWGTVPGGVWAAVADGLGGHRAGQAAAQTALAVITQHVATWTRSDLPTDDWIEDGLLTAQTAVEALAQPHEATPPGTTLLWALAQPPRCRIAHIGDSRGYLVHGDQVTPLTTDMTPAGERVRQRHAPWNEQNTAADSHLLLSCLGQSPLMVNLFDVPWGAGDTLILTTDGLNLLPLPWWPLVVQRHLAIDAILRLSRWSDNATLVVLTHP